MPVEIEIKSLLGGADEAARFKSALLARNPRLTEISCQLNHYFTGESLTGLVARARVLVPPDDHHQLAEIAARARTFSVRTRLLNEAVLLIVKAALDDTTSANGITRMEFEAKTPGLSLDALDSEVLAAGFEYQAKWSRQREAFQLEEIAVSIDKNAGYGYLAEFEIMSEDDADAPAQAARLRTLMAQLGAVELAQDRLERMFAYYNAHWRDYYGTDKTFVIE